MQGFVSFFHSFEECVNSILKPCGARTVHCHLALSPLFFELKSRGYRDGIERKETR